MSKNLAMVWEFAFGVLVGVCILLVAVMVSVGWIIWG